VDADIDQIYVKGEVLHDVQSVLPFPEGAATDPSWKVRASRWLRASRVGAGVGSVFLHFMDNVDAALRQRQHQIERDLARNGCL